MFVFKIDHLELHVKGGQNAKENEEIYCRGPGEIEPLARVGVLRMKHMFRKCAFSELVHLSGIGDKEERRIETTEILIFLT